MYGVTLLESSVGNWFDEVIVGLITKASSLPSEFGTTALIY
jgi:hypothetical protein